MERIFSVLGHLSENRVWTLLTFTGLRVSTLSTGVQSHLGRQVSDTSRRSRARSGVGSSLPGKKGAYDPFLPVPAGGAGEAKAGPKDQGLETIRCGMMEGGDGRLLGWGGADRSPPGVPLVVDRIWQSSPGREERAKIPLPFLVPSTHSFL